MSDQPAKKIVLELAMRFFMALSNSIRCPLISKKHLALLLMQRRAHLILKRRDLTQQTVNTIIHETPVRSPGN